ncbi:MAG: AAA family ATPase [Magnetococcales bacterium]|nr:AAA family ATPase [Magnetococcales bacterium]
MTASRKPANASPNPQPESWDDVAKLVTMAKESEAYLRFLGLKRNPFPVAPDAEVFFLPTRIDTLITEVLHCIHTRKGFLMITGEVGLGKTTVSRRILRTLDETRVETALVFNTFIQGTALLEEINRDFGIAVEGKTGPQEQMAALNRFLIDRYSAGINCAIVIDDAQNLTLESLEMVRMISNLEDHAEKLVQILLVGQPELETKLDAHELRQLKSRIVVHARMRPYDLEELKRYVAFKLTSSGSAGGVTIPDSSYRLLHALTGGNPRRLNNLMDRCLYGLFAYNTMRLSRRLILEVARELNMSRPTRNWMRWGGRVAFSALAVAGMAVAVMAWRGAGSSGGEVAQVRLAQEKVEAELARARSERERAAVELEQARAARESAASELLKARAESEKARESVAQAQVVEAKALTQVANARELSQVEAEARRKALSEAREAREAAESAATRAEGALAEARSRAESQAKALTEATEAKRKAEAEAAEANRRLVESQAEAEARGKALVTATEARQAAEASAKSAREAADKARQEAEVRAAHSEEEKKALTVAQGARERAEKEAQTARQEAEAALQRIEALRVESEKAQAAAKAEAEAKLKRAEEGQREAEAQVSRVREEASRELARVRAEQEKSGQELEKGKAEAQRVLNEALAGRKRAEEEARKAREESERGIQAIEQTRHLDQVSREQALQQARSAHAKAVEEREAEAVKAGALVAKAEAEAKKRAQAMDALNQARAQAEDGAKETEARARKAMEEAIQARERVAQDVELARVEAEKAKQELRIARERIAELSAAGRGEGRESGESGSVGPEVKRFLAASGLGEYEGMFARGLADGWLDGVARRVEEEKGLHLVSLAVLPAGVEKKYPVLTHGGKRLLFWQPDMVVKSFYYDHSGPEVRALQEQLSRVGLYSDPSDGIVGRKTLSAVTQFQKQRHLPVTGYPDIATLFVLSHEQGSASPARSPEKSAASAPVREKPVRESAREPVRESAREPVRESAREPVRESAREPVRESAREPVREREKGGAPVRGIWVIQLASVRTEVEAERVRKGFADQGVETLVANISRPDGRTWFALRTPPVEDRGQAEQLLREMELKFGLKGMIMGVSSASRR